MSAATDLAKAEAEEAEAEEAAEEEEPQTDDEPAEQTEPEAQAPDAEKVMKALEKESARHTAALERIMGDDFATLAQCPLCAFSPAGYVFPLDAMPDAVQGSIREGVNLYVGSPVPDVTQLREAADLEMCDKCDGWGVVRSGSKNPHHVTEICNPCTGNGWKRKPIQEAPPYAAPPTPPTFATNVAQPYVDVYGNACSVPPDQAGRPWGSPDYGHIAPQSLAVVPPSV